MRRFLGLSLLLAAFLVAAVSLPAAAVELHLEAEIAKGAKQSLRQPVEWSVIRLFNDKNPGEVVASAREPSPKFSLDPGTYLVKAKLGLAETEQTVELTKASVLLRFNLNAGILRLAMIPYTGAPVIRDPVHWELFPYTRGGGLSARVAEAMAPTAEFILPAGGWVARARYDGTMTELVVPLEAGQTFNYTLNLYAGKAKLTAAGPGGGAFKDPVTWEVVRASNRDELVASATGASPQVTLREGNYVVLARQGTFAGEAPLEIKAGKTASAKVKMDTVTAEQMAALETAAKKRVELAQAELAPKPAAAPKPATVAKAPAAQTASAPAPAAQAASAPAPQVAAVAPAPAPASTQASTQASGAAATVVGRAKVSAIGASGKAFKDPVLYEVVAADDQNKLIAEATAPKFEFALPAGRYIVLARQGNFAGATSVEVKAGAAATADVPMARVTAEQVAALEQASKKRAELKAVADRAEAAQPAVAAAPTPAPAPAPAASAGEALAAADAVPQAAPVKFEASPTRSLAETLRLADAAQRGALPQPEPAAAAEAAAEEAAAQPVTEVAAVSAESAAESAESTAAPAPAAATEPAAQPVATAAAEVPAAEQPQGSVKVSAWSKKVETFRDAVDWEIRRVQPSGAVLPELVASSKSAKPEFTLPAGSYVIWGRQGTLIGKQRFEIEPAGTVAVRVFMQTPTVTDTPGAAASAEPDQTKATSSGG